MLGLASPAAIRLVFLDYEDVGTELVLLFWVRISGGATALSNCAVYIWKIADGWHAIRHDGFEMVVIN